MNYADILRRADRHSPPRSISSCAVTVRRGRNGRAVKYRPVRQEGLGFSLKPPRALRRLARAVKKRVTLKRVLVAGALVGGGFAAKRLIGKGLRAYRARKRAAAVPGTPVSPPMSAPVDYAATPAPEFARPGNGGGAGAGGGGEAEPTPISQAGAGEGKAGIPTPLIIGGLVLATLILPRPLRAGRKA